MSYKFQGLIAAVFTPMFEDGSLRLNMVEPMVEFLIEEKIAGLYVCGSTGEGASLTSQERKETAEAYVAAARGRLPVIVQVGHQSLAEAQALAAHAQQIRADAIAAFPPNYFKINAPDVLVDCLAIISAGAPGLPIYYYHIPALTGVNMDMVEFLHKSRDRLANLAGIKYSNAAIHEFQACLNFDNQRYDLLFGLDEMLASALITGARGAVGATYNFAAPLYHRILEAFQNHDLAEAQRLQLLSVQLIRLLNECGGMAAFKTAMKFLGWDCGPPRLPLVALTLEQEQAMQQKFVSLGFFDWGRT
ncbi:MAG: dihydrodipicolinate synthase family protein [Candidatus Zhuqueibacterota bacterium]